MHTYYEYDLRVCLHYAYNRAGFKRSKCGKGENVLTNWSVAATRFETFHADSPLADDLRRGRGGHGQ
jgi:hypothetical protein